jgi:hypothetical protein
LKEWYGKVREDFAPCSQVCIEVKIFTSFSLNQNNLIYFSKKTFGENKIVVGATVIEILGYFWYNLFGSPPLNPK